MATVIALVGDIGSGKGAAADYLEQRHGFHKHTVSDYIRSEAREMKIKPTRKNLEKISYELRKKFGTQYFIKKVIARIEKDKDKKVVIDGIRLASDVHFVKKHFKNNIKIVFITANPHTRYLRMRSRARPGDPKAWQAFLNLEEREEHEFHLSRVFRLADYTIKNESDLKGLHKKIDALLRK